MTKATVTQIETLFCKHCEKDKPLDDFYKAQKSECKLCTRLRVAENDDGRYDRTEKGVIRVIYKTQKSNSKQRGHNPPNYSKEWLSNWLYSKGFKNIYDEWVESGYKNLKKPSVDRLDTFKGYSPSNIKLGTWEENRKGQANDIKKGEGTSGKRCMKVSQYLIDGKTLLNTFVSQSKAERETGVSNGCISSCVRGKTKTAGGFVWKQYHSL